MATDSTVCSIHPYFSIPEDMGDTVRSYCERFLEMASAEPGCIYYGFTFTGDELHTREAYDDAAALLAHLDGVGPLLGQMLEEGAARLTRVEVHGPAAELEKLREPLADLSPQYFTLEYDYRR